MKKLVSMLLVLTMVFGLVALSGAEEYDFESTIAWSEESYDVVVIGFGLAGATAAITAADLGAKVLLTEKAPEGHEGGNSKYAGQVIISPLPESHDEFMSYYLSMANDYPDRASDEMYEALFAKASQNVEWMTARFQDIGEEPTITPFMNGYWAEFPEFPGAPEATRIFSPGRAFSGCLFYLAEDNVFAREENIDVWFEAPAKHLIQNPITKEILGVQIEKDGQLVNVRATAGVIMCCGGFQDSVEKMANYLHAPYTTNQGGEYNTGDGIDMVLEVGAQLWHMNNVAGFTWAFEVPGTTRSAGMFGAVSPSKGILVGMNGTRFLSESVENRHGKVMIGGRWMTMPTSEKNFVIVDETVLSAGKLSGLFSEGNVEEIEKGWIVKGETIAELAEKLGMDPAVLENTITTWNSFVDAGVDYQFGRNMANAPKLETAPFYAVQIKPTQYNTQGGARRNEKAEVLNVAGEPIPGLYSAGEFGSMYADMYNGGSNLMECVAYGQIAAESACANLAK